MGDDICGVFVRVVEFLWGKGDRIGGPAGGRGIIVGFSGFNVWMGGGGRLFCGSGGIKVVGCSQKDYLGADIHEVVFCEVGVLQDVRDHSGGAKYEGGIIKGLSGFSLWLEGGRLFRDSGDFRFVIRNQGGVLGNWFP